jgi:phospholipid transport system transporter-binding protein
MATVALPAAVTMKTATQALQAVETALAHGGDVLRLDASALREVDTSAVALLLQARRLAQARGMGFALGAAPAKLLTLAGLYGVAPLLEAAPDQR